MEEEGLLNLPGQPSGPDQGNRNWPAENRKNASLKSIKEKEDAMKFKWAFIIVLVLFVLSNLGWLYISLD